MSSATGQAADRLVQLAQDLRHQLAEHVRWGEQLRVTRAVATMDAIEETLNVLFDALRVVESRPAGRPGLGIPEPDYPDEA